MLAILQHQNCRELSPNYLFSTLYLCISLFLLIVDLIVCLCLLRFSEFSQNNFMVLNLCPMYIHSLQILGGFLMNQLCKHSL